MEKTKELSPYEKICTSRIKELINEYCAGSQQRFAERTGLNKGSVSQYVNGKNIPSEANARKIAKAFKVDLAWVMGYDTIPPGIDEGVSAVEQYEAMQLYLNYMNAPANIQAAVRALLGSDAKEP